MTAVDEAWPVCWRDDVVDFSMMVLAITAASVGHVHIGLKGSEARADFSVLYSSYGRMGSCLIKYRYWRAVGRKMWQHLVADAGCSEKPILLSVIDMDVGRISGDVICRMADAVSLRTLQAFYLEV